MGATSSKTKGSVIKTKVRAVGRLSVVRKQTTERRQTLDELRRKRGEAISVFEDSSEGDISREDITSLPLKNGCHLSDGERNEGFSVTDMSGHEGEESRKVGLCLSDFKKVTRKKTLDETDAFFSIPYETTEKVEANSHCHVCEVFTGHEVYPCRICGKAFHKSCLQKLGRCQTQTEVSLLHSAKSPIGWTCYICDDLSNLLTEEELTELMETFDKYDVNKDSSISKEEFLAFYAKDHNKNPNEETSPTDMTEAELKFSLMDSDNSGSITWAEFLNCETIFMLQQRNKSTLVPLLTSRERELARRVFKILDRDHDEIITAKESQLALEAWYSLFYTAEGLHNGYALLSDENLLHEHFKELLVVDPNPNEEVHRCISWDEFIKDMAIHAIAMRPNKSQIPEGHQEWLKKMITNIQRDLTTQKSITEDMEEDESKSNSSGLSSASIEQLL